MKNENKLLKIEPKGEVAEYHEQRNSIEAMIMKAIEQKVDPIVMEKFLAMRKELKAEWAKEQFDYAMANAQGEFPEIKKTKSVKTKAGVVAYSYAPLETIISQVKEILTKYKLSYSIKTETKNTDGQTYVKSTVIVKHVAGHSETSEMEVPLGNKTDVMSQSQVVAAAATFSKRYAFNNAFGIMTAEEDRENNLQATDDQIEQAKDRLAQCVDVVALQKMWASLAKEARANKDVILFANQIKAKITNEEAQNQAVK